LFEKKRAFWCCCRINGCHQIGVFYWPIIKFFTKLVNFDRKILVQIFCYSLFYCHHDKYFLMVSTCSKFEFLVLIESVG
jgi:hypothetical protein